MAKQVYYEDVEVGTTVPDLVVNITPMQLVKWAGSSGDFNPIHYDSEAAKGEGLSGIIVHGRLKAALLTQLVTNWAAPLGRIHKLGVRYKAMDFPLEALSCRGRITAKLEKDGEHWVEGEVWTENPRGEVTSSGTFAVTLPSVH